MTKVVALSLLAMALTGTSAVLTALPLDVPKVSLRVAFEDFPPSLGDWHADPAGVPEDVLPADRHGLPEQLTRAFRNGAQTVWVSVGYYPSLPEGRRPATHKLLYPAKGWADLSSRAVSIPIGGQVPGVVPANMVLMRGDARRVEVLYWFQLGQQSFASDYRYRAHLLFNRLIHRRSDMALVRIAARAPDGAGSDATLSAMTRFVEVFYPELLRSLPR